MKLNVVCDDTILELATDLITSQRHIYHELRLFEAISEVSQL